MAVHSAKALSPRLSKLFGTDKDIAQVVKCFDTSKVNVQQSDLEDFLKVLLAPSIGTLTKEDVMAWPDELKIVTSAVTRLVENIPAQSRSPDQMVAAMMQNSILEPGGNDSHRVESLSVKDDGLLKRDVEKSNQQIAREIQNWFAKLIGDEDVLRATPINCNDIAAIFRIMQQDPKGLSRFVQDNSQHEKTLLDISVLCYPEITRPYVKLYHIKLTIWFLVDRVAGIALNKSGMTGVYYCRSFKPRQEIISRLSSRVRTLAAQEAEDLFI